MVSVCSAPGTSLGLRQTSRAKAQRGPNAKDLRATLRAERQLCKQELLMADLAQKWLIIKQQRKLHSDSLEASQHIVGNFSSSLGRDQALHWMAFTSLLFAVLRIVSLFSALGSRLLPLFSEQYAGNCLLSAWLCQDPICLRIVAACRWCDHGSSLLKHLSSVLIIVLQALLTIILLTLQLQPSFNSGKVCSFLKVRLRTAFKNF